MKSPLHSVLLKTALLIVSINLYFCDPTFAQATVRNMLSSGPAKPGHLDHANEIPRGSLMVYSATDEFDDGGSLYYAHSSYAIFTMDGKLLKSVENHITRSDEIPEIVSLPTGSYTVAARSERDGYVRRHVVIKAGRRTILDLDSRDKESPGRIAHN